MKPIAILFFVLTACSDKTTTRKINATHITTTDQMGAPTGSYDPSDWRFDDTWTVEELALFNFADTITTTGFEQADTLTAAAYPNPAVDVIRFSFSANKNTIVKMVVTNVYLKPLWTYYAKLIRGTFPRAYHTVQIDLTAYKRHNYYRLYYAFYKDGKVLYAKGHGDYFRD